MAESCFGEYVRELRLDANLTIRELEDRSKVSNAYISQVENGERGVPSPKILEKLAPHLGVSYEDLMIAAGHLPREEKEDTKDIDPIFGERFKTLRQSLNLTQDELANDFNYKYGYGFSKPTISQYENGKRIPETEALKAFAQYFNVTIDYLLGLSDVPRHETSQPKSVLTKLDRMNQIASANEIYNEIVRIADELITEPVHTKEGIAEELLDLAERFREDFI